MSLPARQASRPSPFIYLLIFLFLGYILWLSAIDPILGIVKARRWVETPCVILSSEVGRHQPGSRTPTNATYSVDIEYSYSFGGREFTSSRYQFESGSSAGSGRKAAIVARYVPGEKNTCFVNPDDPAEAVLNRGFTPDMWTGLVPLLFLGLTIAGLVSSRRWHAPR